MDLVASPQQTLSVAVTGSGGSGAVTAGLIFLRAIAGAGFHGLLTRSAGPQIRGGESAAMVRYGAEAVACPDDRYQVLAGLDWLNVNRFVDEIPLAPGSLILADPANKAVPEVLLGEGVRVLEVPYKELAKQVPNGRANMVALGALGKVCGLSQAIMEAGVAATLAKKGEALMDAARACIALGYRQDLPVLDGTPAPAEEREERWNISGNEACGLGAMRGGTRFVAAYPITPASEILEWLAPRLEKLGGSLLQAEDELASVNMIIGGSFGGVPSLTATSGPGLALMAEGLGLAVTSETPITVIDVMRGGPSTGIPTKSEQSDLNLALYGLHGDAPHLVFAPLDIADCAFTTEWAVQLAEHLQTVALVLSDQALGQARAVTAPPMSPLHRYSRAVQDQPDEDYRRYQLTENGVSPMTLPGTPSGMYTADGLEHNAKGTPSAAAKDHAEQLAKRCDKLMSFDYGQAWAESEGEGELCLVTWGSTTGAVREAAGRLRAQGVATKVVALRLLAPLRVDALKAELADSANIWVIEQNHGGQLYQYLRSFDALPADTQSLAQPGPLPLRPNEIVLAVANTNKES